MAQAIFGLVGVLVGALITGGGDFLMERRRESRAFRRSKRLVAEELHTIWVHMTLLVEDGRTPTAMNDQTAARFLPTETWAAHREVLADDRLSDDVWNVLPTLFSNAESLRFYLLSLPSGTPIPPEQLRIVAESAEQVAATYTYLTGRHPDPNVNLGPGGESTA